MTCRKMQASLGEAAVLFSTASETSAAYRCSECRAATSGPCFSPVSRSVLKEVGIGGAGQSGSSGAEGASSNMQLLDILASH